ncbi:MAG: sulfate permease [Ignavibacteria bacterium]|nr:sulfate permease [Ignavibacteria bacterium]
MMQFKLPPDLQPKLYTILKKGYRKESFFADLSAGVIVGIVALPLAIAFAIASGVKPEQGLYSAIIAGLVVSVLSGSRVQISGPTGAFIVIIYGIVQQYGYDGLAIATILAGIFLIILGIVRFGILLRFIPHALTVGFTSGIAIIIFSSQIKDFFGLKTGALPAEFIEKWSVYINTFSSVNVFALAVGAASLLIVFLWPRLNVKIPGSLVAILLSTVAVSMFHLPVETIGTRFGQVPNTLPMPKIPALSWHVITQMVSPAFTIAMLSAIESLLSAVVADGMMGTRHRSNMELIAQGAGNLISPLFLGIPVTGAIARTATNIKNGGRTPVSGIIHAIVLIIIMLFLAPYASLIPMASLAAILIYVSYNMSEWRSFVKTLKAPVSDRAILLITFLLTLFVDLTVAIEVGLVFAALSFIKKMSDVTEAKFLTEAIRASGESEDTNEVRFQMKDIPQGVEIFEVYGSLFFGAVDQFRESIRQLEKPPRVIILETTKMLVIDGSGLKALEDLLGQLEKSKTKLIVTGMHKQPLFELTRSGLLDQIGEDNFYGSIPEALEKANLRPSGQQ